MYRLLPLGLSIVCYLTPQAQAQDASEFSLEAIYVAEIWHNDGGSEGGTVYLDNLGLAATTKLRNGIEAHASLLFNNGKSLSDLAGDSMVISNIETGVEALRLYEAWLGGNIGERTNLKFGFFDVNSEFDVLDSSGLFIGSAHGIGMDIAQTGENGPSIFPVPGFAFRVQQKLNDQYLVRGAIIEGVPGDPDRPERTTLNLGDGEGAFLIAELERTTENGKFLVGAWTYTVDQDTWEGATDKNFGTYLRGETVLKDTGNGTVTGFGRIGWTNGNVNEFDGFASLGLHYAGNNGHEAGIGIAHSPTARERIRFEDLAGGETAIELTYAWPINENLSIQPNMQYVISPSADPNIDDARAFGLRLIGTVSN